MRGGGAPRPRRRRHQVHRDGRRHRRPHRGGGRRQVAAVPAAHEPRRHPRALQPAGRPHGLPARHHRGRGAAARRGAPERCRSCRSTARSARRSTSSPASRDDRFFVVGTPTVVADEIENWLDEDGLDGINLRQYHSFDTARDFAELVVPELRKRGRLPEAGASRPRCASACSARATACPTATSPRGTAAARTSTTRSSRSVRRRQRAVVLSARRSSASAAARPPRPAPACSSGR